MTTPLPFPPSPPPVPRLPGQVPGYQPISEGPRDCIGQALAMLELRVALAMLLGSFSFRLTPDMGGYDTVLAGSKSELTLKPANGMHMFATPRS